MYAKNSSILEISKLKGALCQHVFYNCLLFSRLFFFCEMCSLFCSFDPFVPLEVGKMDMATCTSPFGRQGNVAQIVSQWILRVNRMENFAKSKEQFLGRYGGVWLPIKMRQEVKRTENGKGNERKSIRDPNHTKSIRLEIISNALVWKILSFIVRAYLYSWVYCWHGNYTLFYVRFAPIVFGHK